MKTVDKVFVTITTAAFRKIPFIKELWIELGKGIFYSSRDFMASRATDLNWTDVFFMLSVHGS